MKWAEADVVDPRSVGRSVGRPQTGFSLMQCSAVWDAKRWLLFFFSPFIFEKPKTFFSFWLFLRSHLPSMVGADRFSRSELKFFSLSNSRLMVVVLLKRARSYPNRIFLLLSRLPESESPSSNLVTCRWSIEWIPRTIKLRIWLILNECEDGVPLVFTMTTATFEHISSDGRKNSIVYGFESTKDIVVHNHKYARIIFLCSPSNGFDALLKLELTNQGETEKSRTERETALGPNQHPFG